MSTHATVSFLTRFSSTFRLLTLLIGLVTLAGSTGVVAAQPGMPNSPEQAGAEATSEPIPTTVVVRALSNDAKLIQDPVGGARVVIRHAETGEVLAEGMQTGDSGSTERIMTTPKTRGDTTYAVEGAAKFETTLLLDRPTPVTVTVEGPLDYPQAMQSASTSLLLVPGEDVTGDGIVLSLHGFIVEALAPASGPAPEGETLDVRARVRMLCGCPTRPGGMWDADGYTIEAHVLDADGNVLVQSALSYAGTMSEYEGEIEVPDGATRLRILATDADRVNFGMVTVDLDGES